MLCTGSKQREVLCQTVLEILIPFDVIVCRWQKEQYPSKKDFINSPFPRISIYNYIPSVHSRIPQHAQVIQFTQILAIYTTARFLLIFCLIVSILRVSQVDRPQYISVYFQQYCRHFISKFPLATVRRLACAPAWSVTLLY